MNGISPILIKIEDQTKYPKDFCEKTSDFLLHSIRHPWGATLTCKNRTYEFTQVKKDTLLQKISLVFFTLLALITTVPGVLFYAASKSRQETNKKVFFDWLLGRELYNEALDLITARLNRGAVDEASLYLKEFVTQYWVVEPDEKIAATLFEHSALVTDPILKADLKIAALGDFQYRMIGTRFVLNESKFETMGSGTWGQLKSKMKHSGALYVTFCQSRSEIPMEHLLKILETQVSPPSLEVLALQKEVSFQGGVQGSLHGLDIWILRVRNNNEIPDLSALSKEVYMALMDAYYTSANPEDLEEKKRVAIRDAAEKLNLLEILPKGFVSLEMVEGAEK